MVVGRQDISRRISMPVHVNLWRLHAYSLLQPCLFHAYSVPQPCYSNATCSIPGPRVGSICQVIQPVQSLWIGTWESRTSLLSRHVMVGLTRDKRWFCPLTIREYNELRG